MKALCYAAKLMSGLYATSNSDLSKKLAIFSSKISGARATLRYNGLTVMLQFLFLQYIINIFRLIDDIPMLKYTLEYGLGQKVRI